MKKMKNKYLQRLLFLFAALALIGSGVAFDPWVVEVKAESAKKLSVYYSNWSVYSAASQYQQVKDLPWDRISVINHAFWKIVPNADHTAYTIVSIDAAADLGEGKCFDQYSEMTAQYPSVKVLLSVGGWTDTKWFSEMASTAAGRESFIASCVETLTKYAFFGGIDIDWEYPGTTRNNEGTGFVGSYNDKKNFTALMREMREAFDKAGFEDHLITYCAPSGTGSFKNETIVIDFKAVDAYVDRVNIMTYDMAGGWSTRASHHTALHPGKNVSSGISASDAAAYIMSLGVPAEKINIGSPLYSHGWVVPTKEDESPLGKPITKPVFGMIGGSQLQWYEIKKLALEPGWQALYDEVSEGAYLYNNDPESPYYEYFYTYESERSLQAKLDYINETGLGGLIVWNTAGDATEPVADFPMLSLMSKELGLYNGEVPTYPEPEPIVADENETPEKSENVSRQPEATQKPEIIEAPPEISTAAEDTETTIHPIALAALVVTGIAALAGLWFVIRILLKRRGR